MCVCVCNNDFHKGERVGVSGGWVEGGGEYYAASRRYYVVMAIYERLPWRQKECILVDIE